MKTYSDKLDPRKGAEHRTMDVPAVPAQEPAPPSPPVDHARRTLPKHDDPAPAKPRRATRSRRAPTGGKFNTGRG